MKILVINAGSASLKVRLFINQDLEQAETGSRWSASLVVPVSTGNVGNTVDTILGVLCSGENAVLGSLNELDVVGHRVVHGGTKYSGSVLIDDAVLSDLKSYIKLAPLHQPANIEGIEAVSKALPELAQVAVFDTSFHRTLSESAYMYPVPYDWYEKYGIRRYGFHGINHQYCAGKAATLLGRKLEALRVISCHLGGGSSLCAVKNGESVMTTMGFTPLDGVMMQSRSGSIDPGIIFQLLSLYNGEELLEKLNNDSGLKGIYGPSGDVRDVEKAADEGNHRAKLALEMFAESIASGICGLLPRLGGIDVLVFTGGIGENSRKIRDMVLKRLEFLGSINCLTIPACEELVIAQESARLSLNQSSGLLH